MKTDYASYLKTAAKKLEEVLTDTKGRLDGKYKRCYLYPAFLINQSITA